MRKLLHAVRVATVVAFAAAPVAAQEQGSVECAELALLKDSAKDASALFSQCVSKSRNIELEPGIYSFDKPVSISTSGVAISTKGRAPDSPPCNTQLGVRCAVLVPGLGFAASGNPASDKDTTSAPALLRINGKDVALHHIEFDGMASATTKQSGSLLAITSGASGTTILASEFRNWNGDAALSVVGAKGVSVVGSRFRNNGSQASLTSHIDVKGGSGVKLSQNLLQDSSKFGINISGCRECKADGNVLWQSGNGKVGSIVALRAVGDTLTVRNNYVDCDVFWCNAAYFFGKGGDKATANVARGSTIAARSNFASHALAGFFFGLGATIKAQDNTALAQTGGQSCGKRSGAAFSKLGGALIESEGRAPSIVEASFSAKGLTDQERSKCVPKASEQPRATGDEKALRSVAQVIFPFLLGRAPNADERSATTSQLATGASLKDLFIGLEILRIPPPASGEEVTIMANHGVDGAPQGRERQLAEKGEKANTTAAGGPTVTISSSAASVSSTAVISATVTFSRAVTGFAAADITATNATIQSVAPATGIGSVFTVRLAPIAATSDVTLALAADKAIGSLAPKVGNQASSTLTIPTGYAVPTLSLTDSLGNIFVGSRTVRVSLTKPVTPFDDRNFTCTNCFVSDVRADSGSPNTYLATVNPSQSTGSMAVKVRQATAPPLIAESNLLTWTNLSISAPSGTNNDRTRRITVASTGSSFSVSARDLQCTNCTATQVGSATSGTSFAFDVSATGPGQVRVNVFGVSRSWEYVDLSISAPSGTNNDRTRRITIASSGSSFSMSAQDLLCTNCTATQVGSATSGTSFVFDITAGNPGEVRVSTRGTAVSWQYVFYNQRFDDLYNPALKGESVLSPDRSRITIDQPQFHLKLPYVPGSRPPFSWRIYATYSASPPTSNLLTGGAVYNYQGSDWSLFISPTNFQLSPGDRYLPCISLRLETGDSSQNSPRAYFISACDTLIADRTDDRNYHFTLRGLFNAPYGTAGERPISVEYAVVNRGTQYAGTSQLVFPPYTTAALTFNSVGAAQKDFQITGGLPCFAVKWRFSFPNGVYSDPEIKQFFCL